MNRFSRYRDSTIRPRRQRRAGIAFLLSGLLLLAGVVQAQLPQPVNYQGRVAVDGVNFDGTGLFKFALVDGGTDMARAAELESIYVEDGEIMGVYLAHYGYGYTEPPVVTVHSGTGTGAVLEAVVEFGQVTMVNIVNGGTGYAWSDWVTFAMPPPTIEHVTFWSNDHTSWEGSEPMTAVEIPVVKGLYSVMLGDTSLLNMVELPAYVFSDWSPEPDKWLRVWFNDGVNGFQQLTPDQRLGAVGYAMLSQKVVAGAIWNDHVHWAANIGGSKVAAATTSARGTVQFATDGEVAAGKAVQANDSRLTGGGATPSGWTDDGAVVRLTTEGDSVRIGSAAGAFGKLYVNNGAGETAILGRSQNAAVYANATTDYGLFAQAGANYGVYAEAANRFGVYGGATTDGVYGRAFENYGVRGNAAINWGVYGYAGQNYGVYGYAAHSWGVRGQAGHSFGVVGDAIQNYGVMGFAGKDYGVYGNSWENYGVYGQAMQNFGVFGNAQWHHGVRGTAGVSNGVTGQAPTYGVYGQATANFGVYGQATNYGVYGNANKFGVYGNAFANGVFGNAQSFGVYGRAEQWGVLGVATLYGTGVHGNSQTSIGVLGSAVTSVGVDGWAPTIGVQGRANTYGVRGNAAQNYGVYGYAGQNWGGYFTAGSGNALYSDGNIVINTGHNLRWSNGAFKAFTIDHPLDPEGAILRHFSAEGPEALVLYRGTAVLDAEGTAIVELPEYFDALAREAQVQLTARGASMPGLFYDGPEGNAFLIGGGAPGGTVAWLVSAERDDPKARLERVERPVEQHKGTPGAPAAGTFISPESF